MAGSGGTGARGKLAAGGLVNLFGSAGESVTRLLLLLVLTRGLGAAATGAFVEAMAIFQIVAVLAVLGVDTGMVRFLARDSALGHAARVRGRLRTVAPVVLGAGLVGGTLMWAASARLAVTFGGGTHGEQIVTTVRAMAVFLPVAVMVVVVLAATRGMGTMLPTAAVDRVGRGVVQVLACLVMVLAGAGLTGVTIAWGLAHVLTLMVAGTWLARLTPPGSPAPGLSRGDVVAFWQFTLPRAVSSAFRVLIQWLDVLLVGALASAREAAVYAVASRLLQVCALLSRAVAEIAQPLVSGALAQGRREVANDIFRVSTTWLILVSWPLVVLLGLFAPTVLGVFGQEFRAGATVLLVLAVARLLSTGAGPADMVLLMAGRSTASMAITATSLSLNVALNLVLIPRHGMVGAAAAWAASILVSNGASLVVLWRREGLTPFGGMWLLASVPTVAWSHVGAIAALALVGQSILGLAAAAIIVTAGHAGWLFHNREAFALVGLWGQLRGRSSVRHSGGRVRAWAGVP